MELRKIRRNGISFLWRDKQATVTSLDEEKLLGGMRPRRARTPFGSRSFPPVVYSTGLNSELSIEIVTDESSRDLKSCIRLTLL